METREIGPGGGVFFLFCLDEWMRGWGGSVGGCEDGEGGGKERLMVDR